MHSALQAVGLQSLQEPGLASYICPRVQKRTRDINLTWDILFHPFLMLQLITNWKPFENLSSFDLAMSTNSLLPRTRLHLTHVFVYLVRKMQLCFHGALILVTMPEYAVLKFTFLCLKTAIQDIQYAFLASMNL